MLALKEKSIIQGIEMACERAMNAQKPILFSYSFRFDVRDVLPLLTHPVDKKNKGIINVSSKFFIIIVLVI